METVKKLIAIRKKEHRNHDFILNAVKNINLYDLLFRFSLLTLGSTISGIGATLAIKSTFGADSVALFWESLNVRFGFTLGTANYIFSFFFLFLVLIIDKQYIGVGTVLSPIIQGITMDCMGLHMSIPRNFLVKTNYMVLGVIILAIGCSVYTFAMLGCGSYLGALFAINGRWGYSITRVKWSFDALLIVLSIFFGVFPSLGPIVSILISGFIIEKTTEILVKLRSLLFSIKKLSSGNCFRKK